MPRSVAHTLTYVNHWPALGVRNRPAKHLMHNRRRIAFTQEQEAEQIARRVALGPLEVAMRYLPGSLLQVNQQGCDGIGNHRALCLNYAVPADAAGRHLQRALELGSVAELYFEEIEALIRGQAVPVADLTVHQIEGLAGFVVRPARNQTDH